MYSLQRWSSSFERRGTGSIAGKIGKRLGSHYEHQLEKEYLFGNFRKALDFTIKVGEMAENQNHHPDIYLAWGKVKLTIWTHKIDGLTESDFIFAAKADQEL